MESETFESEEPFQENEELTAKVKVVSKCPETDINVDNSNNDLSTNFQTNRTCPFESKQLSLV